MAAAERGQAAKLRNEASQQRRRAHVERARDDLAYQIAHELRETRREQDEAISRAHAAREQARFLRNIIRDTAEQAASILQDTRAARREARTQITPGRPPANEARPDGDRAGPPGEVYEPPAPGSGDPPPAGVITPARVTRDRAGSHA